MPTPAKALVVSLISAMTFAFVAAPAEALPQQGEQFAEQAAVQPASAPQILSASNSSTETTSVDTLIEMSDYTKTPHGYDVQGAIAMARSEVGTSRPTGWSAPGECVMSVFRWLEEGGGLVRGGPGNPVGIYRDATRLPLEAALPGDVVQYEHLTSPTSWVSGVHTLLIVGVNPDGTFDIIQSNIPGGSGLVTEVKNWTPEPPAGFQAVAWRF